ncbi:Octamer-binding transcription factor [Parasponia andersonii]|uniref:Octamer-binding transcription factor n=1 Tax=Parasponia andersonii TaxID=3476 RepID=A0A2P5AWG3_PARAD|nr:Octamer-binding transcription factor [Parasponia andersonii]
MEFSAQENEMRTLPGSLSYTHLSKEGGERRSRSVLNASHNNNDQNHNHHNGSANINCTTATQTLDPPRPNFQHNQTLHGSRDPDPDRVTTKITLSPGGASAKSSSKTTQSSAIVRYRECLKNHAALSGGNVYDGCGEFMPSGEEGSLEALKCAACQCHRNFHRKEIDGESQLLYSPSSRRASSTTTNTTALMLNPLQLPPPLPSPSSLHHHHNHHHPHHKYFNHPPPIIQPMNVAFGGCGGGGNESSSEDLNVYGSTEAVPAVPFALSKKRFRTKFTQEQKDKMLEFAEKVGWRFQKQDEEEVARFCAEVGVKRQVLKVWMHNNKSTMKLKQQQENVNMVVNNSNMS